MKSLFNIFEDGEYMFTVVANSKAQSEAIARAICAIDLPGYAYGCLYSRPVTIRDYKSTEIRRRRTHER